MPNRQLDTTYQGARYEYATTLSLSALASVIPVPRPEDYGFDQICNLVDIKEQLRYQGTTFGVQTKSHTKEKLIYGGKTDKGDQKYWEIQWLFRRDIPLLISSVNLKPFCLKLYSTWAVWHSYWMNPTNYNRKVTFILDQIPSNDGDDRWMSYLENPDKPDESIVYLGPPIIKMDSPTPNNTKTELLRKCLRFWVDFDMINLKFCKLGIPFMYTVKDWVTDQTPNLSQSSYIFWNEFQDIRVNLLKTLYPMIIALEKDFEVHSDTKNIDRLQGIKEILKDHGYNL